MNELISMTQGSLLKTFTLEKISATINYYYLVILPLIPINYFLNKIVKNYNKLILQ